jgi:hypothetical protein
MSKHETSMNLVCPFCFCQPPPTSIDLLVNLVNLVNLIVNLIVNMIVNSVDPIVNLCQPLSTSVNLRQAAHQPGHLVNPVNLVNLVNHVNPVNLANLIVNPVYLIVTFFLFSSNALIISSFFLSPFQSCILKAGRSFTYRHIECYTRMISLYPCY